MDASLYIAFVITSFVLIVVPGPNVLVIISTSIIHGTKRGLQTVAGTSAAMLIQLSISAISTVWFVNYLTEGFYIIKACGVVYLLYLAFIHLKRAVQNSDCAEVTASGRFNRGFWVSLTNPKTILFFSAFIPQFVSSTSNYGDQILLLSMTFFVLAVVLDSGYALLAAKLQPLFKSKGMQTQNSFSGILYFCAGIWLAIVNRNS